MTLTVKHASLTGAAANPAVLVDGPKWDADHQVTGTLDAGSITGTIPDSRLTFSPQANVTSLAALKALTPGAYTTVRILGYYTAGDIGGGVFVWNSSSSASDNAGTIIQPTLGGVGRWIRYTPDNVYRPEFFGAKGDGSTDDSTAINNTIIALNALTNGGTLYFTDGLVYILGTYSVANSSTMLNALPKVKYAGKGTIKLKDNFVQVAAASTSASITGSVLTVTSGITGTFAVGQTLFWPGNTTTLAYVKILSLGTGVGGAGTYNLTSALAAPTGVTTISATAKMPYIIQGTGVLDGVTFKDFTIDYNGANNKGGGVAWAFNGLINVQQAETVEIDGVICLNNSGSNDFVIGNNVSPPSVNNARIVNTVHRNSGDRVNTAAIDYSSIFVIAQTYTVSNNNLSDGPTNNGAALEVYGYAGAVNDNSVNNYFSAVNIANQPAPGIDTTRVTSFTGNALHNVKAAITIWGAAGQTQANIVVGSNVVEGDASDFRYYLDASSQALAGNNLALNINGNVFQCGLTPAANASSAIRIGEFQEVNLSSNLIRGSYGAAVELTSVFPAAGVANIVGNLLNNVGLTSTAASKIGVKLGGAGTLANVNVIANSITGSAITTGIDANSIAATKSLLAHNVINGATNNYANTGGVNKLDDYASGVLAAMGVNVGTAGSFVVNGGVLGTPSSGVGTNLTALNASNLGSGTVAAARMPALTGDAAMTAGTTATTVTSINGISQTSAWTTYTPAITASTGTITTSSASGRYRQIGKTIILQMEVTVTTAGTGAGQLRATLPFTAAAAVYIGNSRERALTGKSGACQIDSGGTYAFGLDATGTTYIANGAVVDFGITFEVP